MKGFVGVALAVAILAGSVSAAEAPRRLIQFSEDGPGVWMTEAEIDAMAAKKEVGFVDVTDYKEMVKFVPRVAIPTTPAFPDAFEQIVAEVDSDNWWANVATLEAFGTRHRNTPEGVAAAIWVHETFEEYAVGASVNVSIEYFEHPNIDQDSVLARIYGCDASVASEVVVIGGHEDSVSFSAEAPGADDDATGTALVMEIFRAVVDSGFCPRRTVEFHAYAGEEGGLIGSNQMAADYLERGINVISMLQFDMTSYAEYGALGIIRDHTSNDLNNFVTAMLDAYVPDLPYEDSTCGYGCSDHAAWNSRGFPASFPFEAPFGRHNPLIHTPQDTMAQISQEYGAKVLRLGAAYVAEMSSF